MAVTWLASLLSSLPFTTMPKWLYTTPPHSLICTAIWIVAVVNKSFLPIFVVNPPFLLDDVPTTSKCCTAFLNKMDLYKPESPSGWPFPIGADVPIHIMSFLLPKYSDPGHIEHLKALKTFCWSDQSNPDDRKRGKERNKDSRCSGVCWARQWDALGTIDHLRTVS